MMNKILLPLPLLALSLVASAQEKIYGFTLGQPLPLSECRKTSVAGRLTYLAPTDTPCVKVNLDVPREPLDVQTTSKNVSIVFPANKAPANSAYSQVTAMLRGGSLEAITVSTQGYATQQLVYDDLVAKYGPPTTASNVPLQGAGATLSGGINARWERPDVVVEFLGVSGGAHTGTLRVMTRTGAEEINKALQELGRLRTPL